MFAGDEVENEWRKFGCDVSTLFTLGGSFATSSVG